MSQLKLRKAEYRREGRSEMMNIKLGVIETRFAEIIWRYEPMSSRTLVKHCEEELDWKKSTTYTVLKKLCERGLFQNQKGMVSALISREEYFAMQSEDFVNETFQGSLPAFVAAFTSRNKLSEQEIEELQRVILENKE